MAAFGHHHPNYDIKKLVETVVIKDGWISQEIRFYTGVPRPIDDAFWNQTWSAKLAAMGRSGVKITKRDLRYHDEKINLSDGTIGSKRVAREKGIDIRIALDLVSLARTKAFDVAVIFSQDQDLAEAVVEAKAIAKEVDHIAEFWCAYPVSDLCSNLRGIDKTTWIRIEESTYNSCLDPRDYRPQRRR